MGQGASTNKKPRRGQKLHYVQMRLGQDGYINMWPPEWQPYATNPQKAKQAYAEMARDTKDKYRLISYVVGRDGFCDPETEEVVIQG